MPITSTSKPSTPCSRTWRERARHAVDGAEAVGHDADAHGLAIARRDAVLLPAQERACGCVGEGGDAGLEDRARGRWEVVGGVDAADCGGEPALVAAPRPPLQRGVREAVGLQVGEQLALVHVELDRVEPGAQDRAGVAPARASSPIGAAAGVALDHDALEHV